MSEHLLHKTHFGEHYLYYQYPYSSMNYEFTSSIIQSPIWSHAMQLQYMVCYGCSTGTNNHSHSSQDIEHQRLTDS